MDETAGKEPPKHIVPQKLLKSSYLIRCLNDGRNQYFILEDVATRKRQRFVTGELVDC